MTTPTNVTPLRQRMIEDMVARRMVPGTQVGHIRACRRFAAWLKRSPETATADDLRSFQMHLSETGVSAITRNRTMTGLRFLFRVTLRRPRCISSRSRRRCRSSSARTRRGACWR